MNPAIKLKSALVPSMSYDSKATKLVRSRGGHREQSIHCLTPQPASSG